MIGQLLNERYKIIERLGTGGFGETYIAEDKSRFNHRCVVKRLRPQPQANTRWVEEAFQREAYTLQGLQHDQIPELLAFFNENNEFFLVQELIDGRNLGQILTPGKGWTEHEVIFLLRDILQVLAFVHQQRKIHRDIKPANLIIRNSDKKIFLIDFGAVKEVTTQVYDNEGRVIEATGVGTPGYMAPEQARGTPDLCSDIYAVGIVAIEALIGKRPVVDSRTLKVIWQDQLEVSVRDDLVQFLTKMVDPIPYRRYQSALEALPIANNLTQTIISPPPPYQSDLEALPIANNLTQTIISPLPPPPPPPAPPIKYAGFSMRLVAEILDITIVGIPSFVFTELDNANYPQDQFWVRLLVCYVILGFVYSTVMESSQFQGTVGKLLLGIVVTDINGKSLTFEQCAKRYFCKLLSYLTLFIGFFMAGFTKKKTTLHDLISGSLVIRK